MFNPSEELFFIVKTLFQNLDGSLLLRKEAYEFKVIAD
jgi:hypothetical protein